MSDDQKGEPQDTRVDDLEVKQAEAQDVGGGYGRGWWGRGWKKGKAKATVREGTKRES